MIKKNLAAIDIGTNSFHLIVVKILEDGNFEIIDREKEVIRLGEGNTGDIKEIKEPAVKRATETLKKFKEISDSHNAEIKAVATSAVREALNKDEFRREIKEKTNIDIEVISGTEEARLIYLGILKSVPIFNKYSLCIDIGGGSTELIVGKEGIIQFSNSHKIGAVRLTQKFFPDYELSKERINDCKEWVKGEIFSSIKKIKEFPIEVVVGSSGTINSLGFLIYSKNSNTDQSYIILNNYEFSSSDLKSISKEILKKKSYEDRKKIKGLDSKRADIIPAGAIILQTIVEELNIEKITLSDYALREGIVIDELQKKGFLNKFPNLRDIRMNSVMQLAKSSKYDLDHCIHVSKLAEQIFDQTRHIHKLDEENKEYLNAASILHDIGYHISHSQHHKHGQYIIHNSELLGFNENEIKIIGNISRYHRKSHPKLRHKEFSSLNSQSREKVEKLSAILRIADSLDRTHQKLVEKISIVNNDKEIVFNLYCNGKYPEVEIWNLERRQKLFEEIFNLTVRIKCS